ncbi:hypothetical protein ACIGG9_26805 [Pseudonocardia alni]|uniref:hypothetical protein n=1 Tax=Pseudonocardia alni TaxID=33907 RepID=UPI0033DA47F0
MTTSSQNTTATEHATRTEIGYPEQSNKSPRSKPSHPCITIRGSGPASGLPATPTLAAQTCADRLAVVAGWPLC